MTDSQALRAALREAAEKATERLASPEWSSPDNSYIWAKSLRGGETTILEASGWGYLTGGGHGALGLTGETAMAAQKAWLDYVALANPQNVSSLLSDYAALEARCAVLEKALGEVVAIADDFHPDRDSEAPMALAEMREALQGVTTQALSSSPVVGGGEGNRAGGDDGAS